MFIANEDVEIASAKIR